MTKVFTLLPPLHFIHVWTSQFMPTTITQYFLTANWKKEEKKNTSKLKEKACLKYVLNRVDVPVLSWEDVNVLQNITQDIDPLTTPTGDAGTLTAWCMGEAAGTTLLFYINVILWLTITPQKPRTWLSRGYKNGTQPLSQRSFTFRRSIQSLPHLRSCTPPFLLLKLWIFFFITPATSNCVMETSQVNSCISQVSNRISNAVSNISSFLSAIQTKLVVEKKKRKFPASYQVRKFIFKSHLDMMYSINYGAN